MTRLLLATAAAAVLAGTAPAYAGECAEELSAFSQEIAQKQEYRTRVTPAMEGQLRQLRDSAYLLDQAGQEDACEEVVEAIKDMVENPRQQEAEQRTTTYEEWNKREIERLQSAKSLEEVKTQIPADAIIGAEVRNMKNEDLGEIDDILLTTQGGESSYAILSRGGFLGIGEKQIAVPLSRLKVTEDRDVYVLDISEERLDSAPSFERGKFESLADESWRRANDEYFKQ